MRYRRPFDIRQRAAAAESYQRFRRHIKEIREKFPPGSKIERSLFRAYRAAVQDFARELLVDNDKVNVDQLGELEHYATRKAIEYNIESTTRRLHGTD
jgi:hypothetical protein